MDPTTSRSGGVGAEPISPELVIAMGLRWLAGGMWQDIKQVYDVSRASFYCCKVQFLDAILGCQDMAIPFSKTVSELEQQA